MTNAPITVVEIPPFPAAAASIWSDEERNEFIDFIARNPLAGAVIRGTGGVRKVRWARTGMGKRGGVRVIYYYHSEGLPLFLLTTYAKNVQADISAEQKKTIARIVETIVTRYGK